MEVLGQSAFLFGLAVLLAVVEIESEGQYGWGEKFPTWYRETGIAATIWKRFNDKPLTGYHLPLTLFTLGIFLWPMFDRHDITLAGTLRAVAFWFAWTIVWDFSWFVLNPHYGLRKFRKDKVWWFSREPWIFGRVPLGYCMAIAGSLIAAATSGWFKHQPQYDLTMAGYRLGWYLAGLAILVTVITPVYHVYYKRMRRKDERNLSGIFHSIPFEHVHYPYGQPVAARVINPKHSSPR